MEETLLRDGAAARPARGKSGSFFSRNCKFLKLGVCLAVAAVCSITIVDAQQGIRSLADAARNAGYSVVDSEAFGIPKRTVTLAEFSKEHIPPRAFVGFKTFKVAAVDGDRQMLQTHKRFIEKFFHTWPETITTDENQSPHKCTLAEALEIARRVSSEDHPVIYGYRDLTFR